MIEYAPRTKNKMTYDEAILYCQFLDHNGHKDWRLPRRKEYYGIGEWYVGKDDGTGRQAHVAPVRDI